MVKAQFDTTNFARIVGSPEHGPINILEDEIAKVAATFKTTRYGGRTGFLALIVDEEEMQRVTNDGTLNCTCSPKPPLLSPKLNDATSATDGKTFDAEHRQVWYEYYLDQAVDLFSVAAIVAPTPNISPNSRWTTLVLLRIGRRRCWSTFAPNPSSSTKIREYSAETSSAHGPIPPT